MNITIISTDEVAVPKKAGGGTYKKLTVTYKTSFQGKTEVKGKDLLDFAAPAEVYDRLKNATKGDSFNVTTVKNDKGYLDWTEVSRQDEEMKPEDVGFKESNTKPPYPTKSTYETPEERVVKQRMIVRQSSISNALTYSQITGGAETAVEEDIIRIAKVFEDYVYEGI